MSKKKTPCEKLGYKVGDKFKVVDGTGVHYAVGSFITLIHDDGSSCPRFNGVHATFESGDSFFPLDFVEKVAKLKPAKQALADAIHQNGGWPIEVHWLFSTSSRVGAISFWVCRPKFNSTDWFEGVARRVTVMLNRGLPNWHQAILSREEYYQSYPNVDADGWIDHNGKSNPVGEKDVVDVLFGNGRTSMSVCAGGWNWSWDGKSSASGFLIEKYRLHNPEVKPEFCESVTRSIPEPEAKPTIEHLAQDYHNAKDYADRKQQEVDAAKADAEVKLKALELAGEAIGLLVSPITAKQKPELVITDWRDLQVGDEIATNSMSKLLIVTSLRCHDDSWPIDAIDGDGITWSVSLNDWRFIRRP